MWIRQVDLSNFRNYVSLHLETQPGPVVLTGANGSGKTNLLEAISMFMPGRGMRGAGFDIMLHNKSKTPQWAVSIKLDQDGDLLPVGTSWQSQAGSGSQTRQANIDGQTAKGITAFSRHIRLIWLTPAMDRLFAGPAGDRRRFLDRIVAATDLDHRRRLNNFDKLMRQRNVLLAEVTFDAAWMSVLEQQMAEQAIAIAATRLAAIDILQGHINMAKETGRTSVFPAARLMLDGSIDALLRDTPAVQSEDEYAKILYDSRKIDQAAGRTLNGPHRSDLIVFHEAKDMEARACSTGEQKALLIGLVLAQARMVQSAFHGQMPIVLLDEVAAHLDEDRRKGLFDELIRSGAQCWLTGTDRIQFKALEGAAQFLTVSDGTVQQS
ncbi:MAG TPA: DNA replication/repair protein RecF [Rhizobiales bacterium]|nr:DNA replication/repair protein RecF [Hyphomicrobiales bacterium]